MAELCNAKGIRVLLVTLPIKAYTPEVERDLTSLDSSFNVNFFDEDLRKFSEEIDVDFLGMQDEFRASYLKNGKALYWAHLNCQGHEKVGELLANKIISMF